MLKKVLLGALLCLAVSATAASAQMSVPRISITGLVGWTFADGVTTDNGILAGDGNIYTRIDPQDSVHYGFSAGVFVNPNTEVGFLWRRQQTKLDASGTATTTFSDLNIDNYHGYFAYYFGDPEAHFNPFFLGGFGASHLGNVSLPAGNIAGNTQFSTVWGAGIKISTNNQYFGFKAGFNWTPIYVKSDPAGWWCDPYWGGCYVVGNAQYANQFELYGAVTFRFGG